MEPEKTNELYYSDSAIRERCLRMVYDVRAGNGDKCRYNYGFPAEEANILFNYIKTGVTPTSRVDKFGFVHCTIP
jgi:hypothetical protein